MATPESPKIASDPKIVVQGDITDKVQGLIGILSDSSKPTVGKDASLPGLSTEELSSRLSELRGLYKPIISHLHYSHYLLSGRHGWIDLRALFSSLSPGALQDTCRLVLKNPVVSILVECPGSAQRPSSSDVHFKVFDESATPILEELFGHPAEVLRELQLGDSTEYYEDSEGVLNPVLYKYELHRNVLDLVLSKMPAFIEIRSR